ncbi:hypothetical protein J6590_019253 [Homalodisca vitripennis]|nr:hypothetical protein J6590_019253 [Homalodisca vitripennis]
MNTGNLALDVSACSSCTTTIDNDLAVGADAEVESMDTDPGACELDYNLKLPFKLRKRWAMEQKKADGTWLPDSEWRRQKAKKSAERKKLMKQRALTLGGRGNCRPPTAPPEQMDRTGNQSNPSAQEGVGDTYRGVLTGHKLALVPDNFLERRFLELRGRILDEAISVEGVCRELKNEKLAAEYYSRSGGRSIKFFLRVDGSMAEKDSATILEAISRQNAGISVCDWKVVGDVHTRDSRTMINLIDEQSSATLKGRNWRVFIGIE